MTPDLERRASDIPTGIKTNGIGKVSTSHLNLTVCISIKPAAPRTYRNTSWQYQPPKRRYAGHQSGNW